MTDPQDAAARPEGPGVAVEAAAELWQEVRRLVDALEEDDWARPTPCSQWDVHDLVAHLAGLQTELDGAPQPPVPDGWAPPPDANPLDARMAVGVAARRSWTAAQLREELAAAADQHLARLRQVDDWDAPAEGPLGQMPQGRVLRLRCYDLWVHLQDLAAALDARGPILAGGGPILAGGGPGATVAARHVLDAVPYLQARRVGAPEGSTMRLTVRGAVEHDSVLVVRSGRGTWDDDADPGECHVEADAGALTLLCSGRGTPDGWRERGLLRWSGPRGEEFVARARLF